MVICFCEFSNTEHIFNQAKYVNKNTSLARQLFDIHELQYTYQLVTEKYKFFSESSWLKAFFSTGLPLRLFLTNDKYFKCIV